MTFRKCNQDFSVKLAAEDIAELEQVVSLENRHVRPGHKPVTPRDIARLAIRAFTARRLKRTARGPARP